MEKNRWSGEGKVSEINKSITRQEQVAVTTNFKWISSDTEPETPTGYERALELDLDFGLLGKLWGFVEVN